MENVLHNYAIFNQQIIKSDALVKSSEGTLVYEVIRLIDGKFLFLDDHLDRMLNSIQIKYLQPIPTKEEIRSMLKMLLQANAVGIGNVKINAVYNNSSLNISAFYIPHSYPSATMYSQGVSTVSLIAQRPDPNAKVYYPALKQKVTEVMQSTSSYEVVYLNENQEILEGSRSNLFILKDNKAYTAPVEFVLAGITRKYVIEAFQNIGIEVIEKSIKSNELTSNDSLLITGTSPKILPVNTLDKLSLNIHNEIIKKSIDSFNNILKKQLDKEICYL
jgi:branched-chain amino acid aminotransferase